MEGGLETSPGEHDSTGPSLQPAGGCCAAAAGANRAAH